jgi:hypothetical protein
MGQVDTSHSESSIVLSSSSFDCERLTAPGDAVPASGVVKGITATFESEISEGGGSRISVEEEGDVMGVVTGVVEEELGGEIEETEEESSGVCFTRGFRLRFP